MRAFILIFTFLFLGFQMIGCRSTNSVSATGNRKPQMIELDPVKVESGKQVFATYCMACHQENGVGKAGFAPRLNSPDFLGLADDKFIKTTILKGRPGTAMMAYENMPGVKEKVDDVVAYIRSWQNQYANFVDYEVDKELKLIGNLSEGRADFSTYCASCHGTSGGGYSDGGSGPGIGLPGFLSVASDDYIKKTIEIGRAGTAMKPFGHGRGLAQISDDQINNIVVYLKSLNR